jgi:hypothetical protein
MKDEREDEQEGQIQLDRIQPLMGRDQVTIPGPLNPAQLVGIGKPARFNGKITAVRITRNHGLANGSILVGTRSLTPGEIIKITPRPVDSEGRAIRLTDDMMPKLFFEEQALALIRKGYAERYDEPGKIEESIQPTHRTAERAVRPPQRGAI